MTFLGPSQHGISGLGHPPRTTFAYSKDMRIHTGLETDGWERCTHQQCLKRLRSCHPPVKHVEGEAGTRGSHVGYIRLLITRQISAAKGDEDGSGCITRPLPSSKFEAFLGTALLG